MDNQLILLKATDQKTPVAYIHSSLKDLYDRIMGEETTEEKFNNAMLTVLKATCRFMIDGESAAEEAREFFKDLGYLSINNYLSWYLLQSSINYIKCCGNCRFICHSDNVDLDGFCMVWHLLKSPSCSPCEQWASEMEERK